MVFPAQLAARHGRICSGLSRNAVEKFLKSLLRGIVEKAGYHVIARSFFGHDPFADFRSLLDGRPSPVVVDVGAFIGEFALAVSKTLPGAKVHSFEPHPGTFQRLVSETRHLPGIVPVNCGLGSRRGPQNFFAHAGPATSSLLPIAESAADQMPAGDLQCTGTFPVPIDTLDNYAAEHGLTEIFLLKTDTQGYELEVLRGASRLFAERRIRLVYCEVFFREFYRGQADFSEIHAFMSGHSMELCGLYCIARDADGAMLWADALYAATASPQEAR